MILRLLKRLEKNPAATFNRTEVGLSARRDGHDLVRDRILKPIHLEGSVVVAGRLLTVVSDDDGVLEAVDEDDPEQPAISLSPEALTVWRVDLDSLAAQIRKASGLSGPSGSLDERVFLLGEKSSDLAVVLALLPDQTLGATILNSLPSLLPKRYRRIVGICPSFSPDAHGLRSLETLGIRTLVMDPRNPLNLTNQLNDTGAAASQQSGEHESDGRAHVSHSPDFSTVVIDGQSWKFVGVQAKAIGVFVQQWNTAGISELNQQFVLTEIESNAKRLRDVFRGSKAWGALIVATDKSGFFRLKLD